MGCCRVITKGEGANHANPPSSRPSLTRPRAPSSPSPPSLQHRGPCGPLPIARKRSRSRHRRPLHPAHSPQSIVSADQGRPASQARGGPSPVSASAQALGLWARACGEDRRRLDRAVRAGCRRRGRGGGGASWGLLAARAGPAGWFRGVFGECMYAVRECFLRRVT